MKKLIKSVSFFTLSRRMALIQEPALRLLLTQMRDNPQEGRVYEALRRAIRTQNKQDDLDAAALFAYRFDHMFSMALGYSVGESKEMIMESTQRVNTSGITKGSDWNAKKIYGVLYAMRNDIVHYGSVTPSEFGDSYVAGDASRLIIYALALCYQATHNPPARISGMLAFNLALKDIWYALSRFFRAIKSFWRLIVRLVTTFISSILLFVRIVLSHSIAVICSFLAVLIFGGVVWGIVRLNQDDYDLRTTDYEKIAEIVMDISPAKKTEVIQNRFISLYALGKDFRIGDEPLYSIDRSTVALYNMAIEQELPAAYSVHQIGHLFNWILPTEKEDFHNMVAEHRESFVKPKNRKLGNFQYDKILVVRDLFSGDTYHGDKIVKTLSEESNLGLLLVLGNVEEAARNQGLSQRQLVSQVKSKFRDIFKNVGIGSDRVDFRNDSSLPFCLQLYITGVPRRPR